MLRDLRDPIALGEALLEVKEHFDSRFYLDLSKIYDENNWDDIPNYSGEMTGFYTAQEYRKELEGREDKYAQSTLEALNAGPLERKE